MAEVGDIAEIINTGGSDIEGKRVEVIGESGRESSGPLNMIVRFLEGVPDGYYPAITIVPVCLKKV